MELYQPQRYPVIVGNPQSTESLCTCWTAPELLVRMRPELLQRYALIGSLYSREGVSIVLRNLLLNPQITAVRVLADNALSRTVFGEQGWRALQALWESGVDSAQCIVGTTVTIHKELPVAEIDRLRSEVTLTVFEEHALASALALSPSSTHSTRTAVSFPEPYRDENAPMPSEHVGWSVRGKTLLDAWLCSVDRVLRYGSIQASSASRTRELHALQWVIEQGTTAFPADIDWPANVRSLVGLEPTAIPQYANQLRTATLPTGVAYTYGQRLHQAAGSDQVAFIVRELQHTPHSRRAVASLYLPQEDQGKENPPCLCFVQAVIQGGSLHMLATFRSHDIGKAAIPNAFSLLGLMEYIAAEVGVRSGSLAITSNSAHIYEEEWEELRKLVQCVRWSEPLRSFTIESAIDPRGTVHIAVLEANIHLTLRAGDGSELFAAVGKHARPLLLQIAVLDLLREPTHYADIALELAKAELSLQTNQPYYQDKPFMSGALRLS